ncbi:MAG: InlB B-repeat-containing protein [Christensenellaceae bacterium]
MKKKLLALFLCCALSFGLVTAALITPAAADSELMIYSENVAVDTVSVPKNEKKTLAAGGLSGYYQWQIQVGGDVWANIAGATGAELEVGYALVANLLYGGTANIRCRVTGAAEEPVYSNTVTVQITDETPVSAPAQAPKAPTVISEAEPVGEPVIIPPQTAAEETPAPDAAPAADAAPANDLTGNAAPASLADPAPVNDPAPTDNGEDEDDDKVLPATYTILIEYKFEDGKQAANPWSATVAAGSTYTQTITSPVVVGYTPDKTTVQVDASAETTYIVTYHPAEVEFTVKHYQQNVHNDLYTLVDTETKTGYTESAVGEQLAKTDYTGFYSLLYDTTTKIAADGSTVIEVYYDRYYFLLNFDLDGGYGVEPVYARYGAPIGAGTPTKPGYTFEKWTPEIPDTMPAANSSHKASWNIGESGFTVVFWYENANDDGYSAAGTYKPADVAPGTEKKSEDYKDQSFTGRDNDHFTYNAAKAETVTVKGDGSTVLNVYYTRNTYTLTFPKVNLTCDKVEHTHSHEQCCTKTGIHIFSGCNTKKCPVGYEHTHDSSCYGDLTITAKYDSDITSVWKTDPIKSLLSQGYVFKSSVTEKYYSFLEKMPGQNITMTKTQWSGDTYEWYYYLEVPAGMSAPAGATTKTDGGKTYYLYHTVTIKGESITLTYDEDYYPITGFTQRDKNVPSFNSSNKAYLYYTRNKYELKFLNYGTLVKTDTKYYQADISGEGFTPNYPETLENGVYTFDAWYTDQFFSESGKFDFTGAVMPAGPVVLYAHWVSKTHTVKTYQTKDAMENGGTPLTAIHNIPHGAKVGDVASVPGHPVNGNYIFAGWFYVSDTGEEKAFDFSMPVNRDLNLYAKWSSNTLMAYTVKYVLEDGTEIAPPTTGSALAGTTKTFNAKSGTELNEEYQSGYFPKVGSHSITIDIDNPENNTFTFVYVPKAEVEYIVRYLDKATSNPVVVDGVPTPDKTVKTRDAVVTETFKQIPGYAPDAYQKQLVLAAEGNEIIFWYIKDDVHAPVQTIHWVQNIKGDGYAEYQKSTNLNGVIGTEYSETPLSITGFTYNGTKSNASGELTAAGLVLNLYYDRIEYPYEFRFLEQGTNKELADSVTGNARYQAQVTQTAKAIPGYTLVSAENQAINIAIEDPADVASKNVKTFYYTEQMVDIKYQVIGPDCCGTLDNYQESQLKVTTGTVKGAVPTAADGFKFVGWYTDEACTQLVIATWVLNNKITPEKTKDLGNDVKGYEAATYYAKFEADVADLTITKTGCEDIDAGQSFIFTVTGPNGFSKKVVIQGNGTVVLTGLKIGDYAVTEDTAWSWRYTPKDGVATQKITLQPGQTNEVTNRVTFVNNRSNNKWLDGNAYCKNVFGTIIETDSGN